MVRARIGCSGWNYPHWREVFYPAGLPESRWLEHYATVFDTVEINASFYRLPTRKAAERWAASTPPGFELAVKASRYLTHVKRLRETAKGFALLEERIEPLAARGQAAARSCGSSRRTSTGTTSGWRRRSVTFRKVDTASSSGTRAGSCRRCSRSYESTTPLS